MTLTPSRAIFWALLFCNAPALAADYPDLPGSAQVETAINQSITVQNASTGLKLEQSNRRRWQDGSYEFNVRAGSAQRQVINTGQKLKEWDLSVERPVRLPNKMLLDQDIGSEAVARAEYALGDARHEAGRVLLKLWFNWQRERAQAEQWQQQIALLQQQADLTGKRVKTGDAPKMEHHQALSALALATVASQQAGMRAQLAANELRRQFPALPLPDTTPHQPPLPIEHDLAYWQDAALHHNHELGMAQSERRLQQLLAQRSRADQIPDPTLGLRYSSEFGGNDHVTGVYVVVPISFGLRGVNADNAGHQATISADKAAFVERRLTGDIYAAYQQAVSSFASWQHTVQAADGVRQNAELVARAYTLGESSLGDTLTARRLALESTLAEVTAQLDANEARYRLLLDSHQLWPLDDEDDAAHDHY